MATEKKKIDKEQESAPTKRELRKEKKNRPVEINGFKRAVPVILFALALFVALCFFTSQTGEFGNLISKGLKGLFSYMAYAIPLLIAINALFYYDNAKRRKVFSGIIISIIAEITLAEIAYLIANFNADPVFDAQLLFDQGIANYGGGVVGGFFGFIFTKLVGKVGLIVLIAMTAALFILYFIYGKRNGISRFILEKLGKVADYGAEMERRSREKKQKKKEEKLENKRAVDDKKHADFYNDNYFHTDNGIKSLEIPELGILEVKDDAANSHVLRESVIKNRAESGFSSASYTNPDKFKKDYPNISFDDFDDNSDNFVSGKSEFERVESVSAGFKNDDIVFEERPGSTESEFIFDDDYDTQTDAPNKDTNTSGTPEKKRETIRDFGLDDSADAIFTAEFDPYDIAINEKRASKLSSKAATAQKESSEFSEFISDLTPEQMEQKRRLEQFERSRREALKRRAEAEEKEAAMRKSIEEENARVIAMREDNASSEKISDEDARDDFSAEPSSYALNNQSCAEVGNTDNIGTYSVSDQNIAAYSVSEQNVAAYSVSEQNATAYSVSEQNNASDFQKENHPDENAETYSNQAPSVSVSRNPSPANNQYRFAREIAEEPRRQYSSYESGQPTKTDTQASSVNEKSAPSPSYIAARNEENERKQNDAYSGNASSYNEMNDAPHIASSSADEVEESIKKPIEEPYNPYNLRRSHEAEESTQKSDESIVFTEENASKNEAPISVNIDFSTDEEIIPQTRSEHQDYSEFNFGEPGPIESRETIEVSRSMLSPSLEINVIPEDDREGESDEEIDYNEGTFDNASSDTVIDELIDEDEENEPVDDDYAEEEIARVEIPEDERNPKINEYRAMFTVLNNSNDTDEHPASEDCEEKNETSSQYAAPEKTSTEDDRSYGCEEIDEKNYTQNEQNDDEPPFDVAPIGYQKQSEIYHPIETTPPEKKKEAPAAPDYSNYKFPPYELLKKVVVEDADQINEEMQFGSDQLLNTLESFNIKATMKGMERGPRITRYSIVPAKGIRVNQIEKLSDDIALAMAAESIRIEAPIPGKSAVGIEVPNKVPSIVSLRELLESPDFINESSKTTVCIGKSVEGTNIFGDIGNMPHLLIAGATGMGKSVCMNALITSILYKARPDEVKFIMIDPKKVEFAPYNGIPHLLVPVVTDPKQAAGALLWAVDEMNKRYDIIEKLCVRNIDSYNEKVAKNPELGAPMTKIIILIDELNDLMIQVRDPVENLIMSIAQKARAAGIHLVIGTQRPSVNVITGVIKANIPSRIACKVSSGIDSRTIIEQTGAEKLIGKGDMLFAPSGKAMKRVQGAFVSEAETAAIVDFVKAQTKGEQYDAQAMEDMRRAAQKCDKKNGEDDMDDGDERTSEMSFLRDKKFLQCVEIAIKNGSVATSFLQRRMSIGYGKAAKYIDGMEELGIIEEKNGSKARNVLISLEEWHDMLDRRLSVD